MDTILGFIVGILVGYFVIKYFKEKKLSKMEVKPQKESLEENKEKVLELFKSKEEITNNDVEESLNVSDATATRYLDRLEEEGKIKQVGKTGRFVHYRLK